MCRIICGSSCISFLYSSLLHLFFLAFITLVLLENNSLKVSIDISTRKYVIWKWIWKLFIWLSHMYDVYFKYDTQLWFLVDFLADSAQNFIDIDCQTCVILVKKFYYLFFNRPDSWTFPEIYDVFMKNFVKLLNKY